MEENERESIEAGICVRHPGEVLIKCSLCMTEWNLCNEHKKLLAFCLDCFDQLLLLPAFKGDDEKEAYEAKLKLNRNAPNEEDKHSEPR